MRYFAAVTLMFLLGACAPATPPHVTVESDDFSRDVAITGYGGFDYTKTDEFRVWRLKTLVNKDTHAVVQKLHVRFVYIYRTMKYFYSASDDTARQLKVHSLYKTGVLCGLSCKKTEDIEIDLDPAVLERRAEKGFRIKVIAKSSDEAILTITPKMIRLQREAIERYRH